MARKGEEFEKIVTWFWDWTPRTNTCIDELNIRAIKAILQDFISNILMQIFKKGMKW